MLWVMTAALVTASPPAPVVTAQPDGEALALGRELAETGG